MVLESSGIEEQEKTPCLGGLVRFKPDHTPKVRGISNIPEMPLSLPLQGF